MNDWMSEIVPASRVVRSMDSYAEHNMAKLEGLNRRLRV